MRPAAIEARGLTRRRPEGDAMRAVVDSVDLAVLEGTLTAVMGPSGSGKTTLLHLLSGLDVPDEGSVQLEGCALDALDDEARTLLRRERVGFVFQFFNLVPHLTVAENISLPLMMHGVREPRSDPRFSEIVEFLGLGERLGRLPHALSGGEMQRTSIARALVHRPAVVFADEPTGNLSSAAGREVMEFLRRSVDGFGTTVLLVTHNPRDAGFADEVHFMTDGTLAPRSSLRGEEAHEDRITARMAELGI